MKHQELFIIVFMISIPVFLLKYKEIQQKIPVIMWICVTVHRLLSRKVFWHVYAKIPGHTGQNAITEGQMDCNGTSADVCLKQEFKTERRDDYVESDN